MTGLLAIPAAMMLASAAPQAAPAPVPSTAPAAPAAAEPAQTAPATSATAPTPVPAPAAPGEIVVSARHATKEDPLAGLNAKSYEAIQAVDNAVVGPVAHGYQKGVPGPVRSGLRNVLRNLDEPVSAVNYLLQLKPGRAVKSLARFTVNTTFGVAGLVDVAKTKPFNLPYRPNGFANTFACWGIGNGPYFFVPLAGPITLRDLAGLLLDRAAVPFAVGKPFNKPYYALPAGVIDSLNDRIEMDGQLQRLREESPDPYVATRDLYLKQRRAEVGAICPSHGDAKPDPNLPPRVGKGVD
ncbi:VacJ family lipoprotein [Novosphingobium bradum]|uniref:VacJ family lipoprotein n=1 Tax=Novosphingobium bradum TaxID=1737444 RepID=A0ABV7IPA1_9SPHN